METETLINRSIEMNTEQPKTVELTEEDKQRFFKSILADKPYEESFELFDGQLSVKFRTMTVQENSDVVAQIVADRKKGTAAENDAYMITISAYRLGLCILAIDGKEYSTVTKSTYTKADEYDSYVLERAKTLLAWSTPKLSIFLDAFQQFEAKTIKLSGEVQSKNFWKAST